MLGAEKIERFLTALYQKEDGTPTGTLSRLSITTRHPLMALSALRFIMQFPIVRVEIPRSEMNVARWIHTRLRPLQGIISSYIELPSPPEAYWQGPSRQNLRTRTRQARNAGFSVRVVETCEILDIISQVFRTKGWEVRERDFRKIEEPRYSMIGVAVFDQYDAAVAFCVGAQTGNVVQTLWSSSSQKGPVRWLCFSGFVEAVSAQGGKFIVESPPWAFFGQNLIFAKHLGFSTARIRRASE